MTTPESAGAVEELRTATRSLHDRLDRDLPLAREHADLADYVRHLMVMRDWQCALVPWLTRTDCDLSGLALAQQDIDDGPTLSAPALAPIDTTPMRLADDGSAAFCWGATYVLEGSRLGGLVLYRRLHSRLAPHPLRYLRLRGETGRPWPETLALLRGQLVSPGERRSACRGAVAAFELLVRRFEDAGCL
ncbi:hypothetical protein RD110_12085 [Rhodoferax koreense]|uniref:Heme oxygenase n=1 Tax=Rhodoferax koreensis TaxID=1842727 RepID=A0A1P8JVQ0_9BURK|nr:biliverdin-producing heme oxygenase [Rhodoferax koreense]APW37849.1 hypothetical protein RD110_12085 [Rhodoferax koreense]